METRTTVVCAPVMEGGLVEPRWGRAARVAVATIEGGRIATWREFDVGWDRLHDADGEGMHHARVARFLTEHQVRVVAVQHMGEGMRQMLSRMGIAVRAVGAGDAKAAALSAADADGGRALS